MPENVKLAAEFDRSELPEKIRVHALAKRLKMTSKDMVLALETVGLVKVAMSTLSVEEAGRVLDHLAQQADVPEEEKTPEEEPLEKIRHRVEKNVANEIHQIEEKVERELAESDLVPPPTPPQHQEEAASYPVFMAPSPVEPEDTSAEGEESGFEENEDAESAEGSSRPRRRRTRRSTSKNRSTGKDARKERQQKSDKGDKNDKHEKREKKEEVEHVDEPVALRGSTRLEAQRRRRSEMRDAGRRHLLSQKEFLERREAVERTMIVRERQRHDGHPGRVTQIAVLEDGKLVEHFVTSEEQASMIGNIYLGRVQNVLPSMEAAFIDIGVGRNGVLYAGEVDWRGAGLGGRQRRIEQALHNGDQVLVQVTKDPIGQKGARLSTHISLAGRYLVYVPKGRNAGISRKLPTTERRRLKDILQRVVPEDGGAIIRTAAEGVDEEAIAADVHRLHERWEQIEKRTQKEKNSKGAKPVTMYEEPDVLIKVVRDLFNEDFSTLIIDGDRSWNRVHAYVTSVAPDLADRLVHFRSSEHDGKDAFAHHAIDEQIEQGLARTVPLPSGGSLVIDRTEAMTVIDVNTGRYTGSGGNLEESVTRNNIEAAEEIVRQLRLRDIGGMIVIDFIDMVLPENRDLVLRKLTEALALDRSRHQVSEVTSLGLVQLTRKRVGTGLLETFTTQCECCEGRGILVHQDPVDHAEEKAEKAASKSRRGRKDPSQHPTVAAMHRQRDAETEDSASPEGLDVESPESAAESEATSIEDLAAAVVKEDIEDAEEYGPRRRRRSSRRGGRGRSRGRGRAQEEPKEQDSAEDTAAEEDAQNAAQNAAPAQSYEEALAAFEASPRRKRKTRGNSRSDHRPTPEDFEPAPAEEPTPDNREAEVREEHDEHRQRPRRAQRKRGSGRQAREEHRPKEREDAQAQDAPEASEAPEAVAEYETEVTVQQSRRGRRRAVRRARVAARQERAEKRAGRRAGGKATEAKQEKATESQAPRRSEHGSGRGRRRAVRRMSRRR
ncbi:translation initiation factor IF-2 N-terminal domain-containing protein [Corynebacterium uropygiale]|uniref:translation initiation factor IF-2 N-terminal domain-containing protein n=1 Tax=Corynebacterium uropygiale TaxID=1775911 RepID=UPI003B83636B